MVLYACALSLYSVGLVYSPAAWHTCSGQGQTPPLAVAGSSAYRPVSYLAISQHMYSSEEHFTPSVMLVMPSNSRTVSVHSLIQLTIQPACRAVVLFSRSTTIPHRIMMHETARSNTFACSHRADNCSSRYIGHAIVLLACALVMSRTQHMFRATRRPGRPVYDVGGVRRPSFVGCDDDMTRRRLAQQRLPS